MGKSINTQVSEMKVREKLSIECSDMDPMPGAEQHKEKDFDYGEAFMKNLAVAAVLVLCAITLRTGAIPSVKQAADMVMTAAADHSLLDERLGKLSFVSALFPEAVLVFGADPEQELILPVSGGTVVHTWIEAEPYMTWRSSNQSVVSALSGEVTGVYHGNNDEYLVQISDNDGLSCIFGNMGEVHVKTGDAVVSGDKIGKIKSGEDLVLEVKREGVSIDPTIYMAR